ncbi:MAG: hypothetical protein QGD88_12895, partial [Anaerolineae bacterium]|nr:hypothetical protein [Anaerolineae bacterium]
EAAKSGRIKASIVVHTPFGALSARYRANCVGTYSRNQFGKLILYPCGLRRIPFSAILALRAQVAGSVVR